MSLEYYLNPVKMGGLVKEAREDAVKVHLHGRLGVITVPPRLILTEEPLTPGHELEFYFSYIQINRIPYDYDSAPMDPSLPPSPVLLGGTVTEVNDTAARISIMDGLGTVAVPRRWIFTDVPLAVGQSAEFYLSTMKVVGKRDIPAESI